MFLRHSLNGDNWQVRGYLGMVWQMGSDDLWADRPGQEAEWIPATVPGMVQTDLIRAGVIPDPYSELNSFQCEWVPNRDWVYRRALVVEPHWKGQRIRLRFHGVDYRCRVSLNEHKLGEHKVPPLRPILWIINFTLPTNGSIVWPDGASPSGAVR